MQTSNYAFPGQRIRECVKLSTKVMKPGEKRTVTPHRPVWWHRFLGHRVFTVVYGFHVTHEHSSTSTLTIHVSSNGNTN